MAQVIEILDANGATLTTLFGSTHKRNTSRARHNERLMTEMFALHPTATRAVIGTLRFDRVNNAPVWKGYTS